MKKIIIGLIIIAVLIIMFVVGKQIISQNNLFLLNSPKATIQKHSFNLLIAKTEKEKEIGLSNKDSLPNNYAMLFQFEKPDYYSFWMKNMKFPIDIIFIKNNKIITIYKNVKPVDKNNKELAIYQPAESADSAMEINAGLSDKYGFKKDMEIKYENLGN